MSAEQIVFEPSYNYEDALWRMAVEYGINSEYWDIFGNKHSVTSEVRRAILAALGVDVQSRESIDEARANRFRLQIASAIPSTVVVGDSYRVVPISLPGGRSDREIRFEITTEENQKISGTVNTSSLRFERSVSLGNDRWSVYSMPVPSPLPLGYHRLRLEEKGVLLGEGNLIVCPDRAYLPDSLGRGGKTAGLNVTLYGLRSNRNWGCGDFTDLKALLDWATDDVGVSFVGVNPLHALHNRAPYNTSPYLPLSIFYKNLIYIDIEAVPEFRESACTKRLFESPRTQEKLKNLRNSEFVAYEDVDRVKRRFLKLLFRQFERSKQQRPARAKAFADYCEREGDLLHKFALYCALDEQLHKEDRNRWTWQHWPEAFHSPDSEACQEFAREHRRLVDYYKYIQFVIEEQLADAQGHAKAKGLQTGLYHDLALATDSCGSDLWAHRDFYVNGCRVGAPPDDFSPNGQDWAFPPPNSDTHWKNGYRLYRESIRKIVRHGGALRIDHVMRLFRLFWIPDGFQAAQGIYVRDRAKDLMRILALESVRSQNIIIGEDLGTVTDEIRDMLAEFRILSYRLFYFERYRGGGFKRSAEYPRQALVASTTHDLPTIQGFWTNRDIEARRNAGLADEPGYRNQLADRRREKQLMIDRLHEEGLLAPDYPRNADLIPEVDGPLHNAIIGFLARVPSMILLLNQEDLTKESEQQNLPGSTSQYPNWSRKMKLTIEELNSPAAAGYVSMFRNLLIQSGRKQ